MEESLLAKSGSFRFSKNYSEPNPYFVELSELIENGNFTQLNILLQYDDYKAVIPFRDQKTGSTLLHLSSDKKDEECLLILLAVGANPNAVDKRGRTSIHKIVDKGCHCELCTIKSVNCLRILINNGGNVNAEDKKGKTPLYYAADNFLSDCAITLLDNGADLQHSIVIGDENLATTVVEKIPGVLEKEFDKCIQYDEEDNSKLKLDFGLILQTSTNEQKKIRTKAQSSSENGSCCSPGFVPCETELLYYGVQASGLGRESLLTHPLTEAFLHLKWLAVRNYFLVLRSVYFFLAVLYTLFVFNIFVINCPYDYELKKGVPRDEIVEYREVQCEDNMRMLICGIVTASVLILMILSELYKLFVDKLMYFRNHVNYAWWILILSVIITTLPAFGFPIQQWQYPMSAFTVICTWTMNLAQMGRIPQLGVYVEVLVKVLKDFGLFLITYSSLIAAFALGFSILIPDHEVFYSVPLSFLKVLLMMTGDVDFFRTLNVYENPRLQDLQYSIPTYIIYGSFVVVMTIVLMSLLIGLAASDIQQLQKDASVSRSVRLIREIYLLELLSRNNFLFCGLTYCFTKIFSINKLRVMEKGYVSFCPVDADDDLFPTELKQKFVPYLTNSICLRKKSLVRLPPGVRAFSAKEISSIPQSRNNFSWEKYVESTDEKYNDLLFSMQEMMLQNQLLNTQLDNIALTLNNFV